MRLKAYTAANMNEAFALVKQELGADAIIVNTENTEDGGVRITAAEEEKDFSFSEKEEVFPEPRRRDFDDSRIRESLKYHGVIKQTREKILANIRQEYYDSGEKDDKVLLERCLNKMFGYYKMLERKHPFKLFMGITGSGKSTAIAKVATQAKFKKISCCIVSTDNIRAGANNQLQAFAEILETPFSCAKDAQSLYEKAASSAERYELVLVDTPGINPFEEKEVSLISPLVRALKADVIMTMDAGRNSYDSVEIAEIFSKLGARYLLPTRMDLTRRIGGIISVAESTGMALGAAGVSSSIVQGIAKIDAKSLARLLLV